MPRQRGVLVWGLASCVGLVTVLIGFRQWANTPAKSPHAQRPVSFNRDVAPIVFAKCATCHHPGESAPFSLLTYEDVRHRARQIVEVTSTGFMPPWQPSEGHGDFVGARRLTEIERQTFSEWADAGSPRGDPADLPAVPVFTDGWQTGTPDLILESPAYTLASADRDVFRNFVLPVRLDGARWVQSIELRPNNPRVTHHARLGIDNSNESTRRDAEDEDPGYTGMAWGQDPDGQLVTWAPGLVAHSGTPGVAWRLPAETSLVLHTHMQPSGKPETVSFRVGIRFAKDAPTLRPALLRIGSCDIDIPAGAPRHTVSDQYTLPIDVDVQTIFPHAHSLCRELSVTADRPDGSSEPLIKIAQFDENWHDNYRYRHAVRLPRGTRLVSTFVYDNSTENIRNRNRPPRRVVYGSNVTDEMADVYLQVTAVHADQRAALMEHYKQYELRSQVVGFRKSLELDPDNPWSQEGLAASLVGLGEARQAIPILEQRVKVSPKAVFPMVSLGMALSASGDSSRAEAQHRRALELDDKYPLAWFGLGKSLADQKRLQPAEQAYRRAVELAPGMLDARLSLADVLIRQGQLEQAADVCLAAISHSPDAADAYLKMAEISAKRRNEPDCLKYCTLAQRFAPYIHPPKVLLAVFCCANGDQDRGIRLLLEARAESPGHPIAAQMLGQLARQQQQGQIARGFFDEAAARRVPDNWPESHKRRFLILLHSERYQLAQQLQDGALARDALTQWQQSDPQNRQVRQLLEALSAK